MRLEMQQAIGNRLAVVTAKPRLSMARGQPLQERLVVLDDQSVRSPVVIGVVRFSRSSPSRSCRHHGLWDLLQSAPRQDWRSATSLIYPKFMYCRSGRQPAPG